jgi:type I restriction enzyme, S subunit
VNDEKHPLPSGWVECSIGDLVVDKVTQGKPSDPVSYIDISAIDRERKTIGELKTVSGVNAPTRARQWVKSGDVLVSMTRPNLNAVALVEADLDGAVASTGFDVLRSVNAIPKWVYYIMSPGVRTELRRRLRCLA